MVCPKIRFGFSNSFFLLFIWILFAIEAVKDYNSRTPFEKFIFEIFFRKIDRIPAKSILPKQQGDTWGIHSWLIKILMIKKACFGVVYIGMDFGLSLNKQKRGGCRDRRCTSYVNKGRLNVYRWKPIRNALYIIFTAFRSMRRNWTGYAIIFCSWRCLVQRFSRGHLVRTRSRMRPLVEFLRRA